MPKRGSPSRAKLRKAVERAAGVVPVPYWTLTPAAADGDVAQLVEAGSAVQAAVARILERWDSIKPVPPKDRESDADATANAEMEAAVERIKSVFGPGFPVLPPFAIEAPRAAEWGAGLADQVALWKGRSRLALVQWLRTLALVRPAVRELMAALDAAAWTGHPDAAGEPRVVQLPHAAGRTWAGLPFEEEPPVHVRASAVMLGEPAAAGKAMFGVLLDEWTEAIPERSTTTSVSFQYDAPGARPPQTICLAVDGGAGGAGWTADALVSTVNELFDLSRLRMVTPQQIAGHGAVLPTVFIPHNLSSEQPSFDVLKLYGVSAAKLSMIVGKT